MEERWGQSARERRSKKREEKVYEATESGRPGKYGGQRCVEIRANVSLRRAAAPSSLNLLNDTLFWKAGSTGYGKHRAPQLQCGYRPPKVFRIAVTLAMPMPDYTRCIGTRLSRYLNAFSNEQIANDTPAKQIRPLRFNEITLVPRKRQYFSRSSSIVRPPPIQLRFGHGATLVESGKSFYDSRKHLDYWHALLYFLLEQRGATKRPTISRNNFHALFVASNELKGVNRRHVSTPSRKSLQIFLEQGKSETSSTSRIVTRIWMCREQLGKTVTW